VRDSTRVMVDGTESAFIAEVPNAVRCTCACILPPRLGSQRPRFINTNVLQSADKLAILHPCEEFQNRKEYPYLERTFEAVK
jgi:hypothetical protein